MQIDNLNISFCAIDLRDKLQGKNSDDFIEIFTKGNRRCVRKIFTHNLNRAIKNIQKQKFFTPLEIQGVSISASEILSLSEDEGIIELVMWYESGMSGETVPLRASKADANKLSETLSGFLLFELNNSVNAKIETKIFTEKLEEVISYTRNEDLKKIISRIRAWIKSLPEKINMPIGKCHGDLTLSNIIFKPNSHIVLIDFLETYLESPLQDVAKLKQDFDYGWSFRKETNSMKLNAEIMCEKNYPLAISEIEKIYPMQVKLITLMALCRIGPYIKDKNTEEWLVKSLLGCLEENL